MSDVNIGKANILYILRISLKLKSFIASVKTYEYMFAQCSKISLRSSKIETSELKDLFFLNL